MSVCAKRRCRRKAREAFDVGSWWRNRVFVDGEPQNVAHYEVCSEHATYFARPFDRAASEAVKRDLVPWRSE